MDSSEVKNLSDGAKFVAPAEKLRKVIEEIEPELGHRRPHVRAAFELVQLIADDPNLSRNRYNGFKVFLLVSDVLYKARRCIPGALCRHATLVAHAAGFRAKIISQDG